MDKRCGILIVSVTISVLCFVGTASATNWSVDGSGGVDFTGIQDAINNARDGDTILVYSGVYYENVVVNKSVTLKGIGHPIVDAGGIIGSAITLSADGITLKGFNAACSGVLLGDAGIKVISSNNTITGNNASNNYWYGIALLGSSNNTITGNNASSNNRVGIELLHSCDNNITDNHIRGNNWSGIFFERSSNNTVIDNKVSNNSGFGIFYLDGITLLDSSSNNITGNIFINDGLSVSLSYQNTVEDNTVNGKPLVYLEDVSDYKVEDAGQVILINCNNITVENLDLSNISAGIELWATVNSKISNNNISNNWDGIILYKSCSNTITGNKVSNNSEGIRLHDSSNNRITGNKVSNNSVGILPDDSNNNHIYFNNFINNTYNVYSYYSTNIWNSTEEITYIHNGTTYESYLGNYWDDYEGTDAEGDGIGNTPYSLDSKGDESDDYPLMKPFENYNIPTLDNVVI